MVEKVKATIKVEDVVKVKVKEIPEYTETINKQMSDVKQALVDKGMADESTTNSECAEKIKNVSTLKGVLDVTKSANNLFNIKDENLESVNHLINYEDTENVTTMEKMYGDGIIYLKELPTLNTSKVTTIKGMTSTTKTAERNNYIENIPYMDTSNVVNMNSAFRGLKHLKTLPILNTSKVTDMSYLLGSYDSSDSIYDMYFETMPLLDTANVITMQGMFAGCINLKTIPPLNTSNVTNMAGMFFGCRSLESIPDLDFSKATSMDKMFRKCTTITNVPKLNINKPSLKSTFSGCTSLHTIEELNLNNLSGVGNQYSLDNIFTSCTNLTNINLLNIHNNLTIGSGTSWGHLLTLDSLINTCKECIKQSSSKKLTMGSANLEKLVNVYVKFTDPTQTNIAVGEKGDVIVCESTDEGAMDITTYMTLKNWEIL